MSNRIEKLASDNPEKYPSRMGKKWDATETLQLLESIKNKKDYYVISNEHERTVGGITAQIKKLAVEYHNKLKPIEEIEIITGLTKEQINEAIYNKKEKDKLEIERKNNRNDGINDRFESDVRSSSGNQTINHISMTCNCTEELKNMKQILSDIQNKLDLLLNLKLIKE